MLKPEGFLLIQTLDYDWLEEKGILTLPERSVGASTFNRHYEVKPSGLWTFHTALRGPAGVTSAAFDLKPWRRGDLEKHLRDAGFAVAEVWGGFDRTAPGSSLPLVILARLQ